MNHYAVAIDGPAGSGKSTVAKEIAKRGNLLYIDTGAMYRAVGLYCSDRGINTSIEKDVIAVLDNIKMNILLEQGNQKILLNGEDVTERLRSQEAGKGASDVAVILAVREKLTAIQRGLAEGNSVIMDGRDIGTHVLPNAEIKIYLNANAEERAKRRCHELELLGEKTDFKTVKSQIEERDTADKNRKYNPLRKAEDAIEIDTSSMEIREVVETIFNIIQIKLQEKR